MVTLLEVEAEEDMVAPPSNSSSVSLVQSLEIPESVDTESTAEENPFIILDEDWWSLGGVLTPLF